MCVWVWVEGGRGLGDLQFTLLTVRVFGGDSIGGGVCRVFCFLFFVFLVHYTGVHHVVCPSLSVHAPVQTGSFFQSHLQRPVALFTSVRCVVAWWGIHTFDSAGLCGGLRTGDRVSTDIFSLLFSFSIPFSHFPHRVGVRGHHRLATCGKWGFCGREPASSHPLDRFLLGSPWEGGGIDGLISVEWFIPSTSTRSIRTIVFTHLGLPGRCSCLDTGHFIIGAMFSFHLLLCNGRIFS